MKKFLLTLLGVLMLNPAFARDFIYKYEGQILIYTVISEEEKTCEIKEARSSDPDRKISGDLVLPSSPSDGDTEYILTTISEFAFYGCSGLTSVTIPNTVSSIGDNAFRACSGLTTVTIPNSISSIGKEVFLLCSGLTSISIPNSVSSIGESAFSGCSALTSVTIPNSVSSIGESAFSGCSGLTSVTIPNSVSSIGESAFYNCTGLTEYIVEDENEYFSSVDGVLYNKDLTELIAYPANRDCSEFTIPSFVNEIFSYAFSQCKKLEKILIPNSVTSIGSHAFSRCSGLTSVSIPESVTSINVGVFNECTNLTSVEITNSVTSIGELAFYGCNRLKSIDIPNSVIKIGRGAFSGCNRLKSIDIPNSVTSIGSSAFSYCSELTSVALSESVTSIGNGAFSDCLNLESVFYNTKNPVAANRDVFGRTYGSTSIYEKATLYVPEETVSKCMGIIPWVYFDKIEAYEFAGVEEINADGVDSCKIYNLNGTFVSTDIKTLKPGIYVVRQGGVSKKIVVTSLAN